jgi:Flp pilus assembly protein TadD
LKPDGTVVTVGPEAVQELTLPILRLAPIYTDYKQKHVTVPSLRPGDILETESATIGESAIAPNEFWMLHDFQKTAIVTDEQLEVDVPAERSVKVKSKPGIEPKISEQNGRRIYLWSSSHLVREEQSTDTEQKKKKKKKPEDQLPDVQLTSFRSWEQVGRWYQGLEKDQRMPTAPVRAKADELTKGLQTTLEKIQAIYEYTSKNFRYVSLSLGLGRYQPHSAEEVLRNQYGDCKDKNTLLEALLEAEGIHAAAVLMNAYRKLDADVPSPSQLNHVITMVPLGKDEIWMDTTAEVAPFRLVPYPLRHKQALLVSPDGAAGLVETPADPALPNMELLEIDGAVDAGGTLNAKIGYELRGDSELVIRRIFRSVASAQWQQIVENMSAAEGLGKDVTEVRVSDTEAIRQPFTFSYRVSKPGYLDWTKQKIDFKLPLTIMSMISVDPDDQDNREPTKLGASNSRTYKLRLDLPSKYTVRVPVPVSVKRDYGAYDAKYQLNGAALTAERTLSMQIQELPPDRIQDYIAFRRAVMADVAQVVSLETSVAVSDAVPEGMKTADLIKNGAAETRNGNYKLAITLLKRAVEAEPKDRNAWNDLGLSYFGARQDDLAISAFQKQIEIDPYHQYAYNNLGRVYLRQRKYDEAIKWFRKQIEVVPLDKYAHANLGYALVDSHKWQDAIPELQQAASLTPNNAGTQIWLGEAYLKLGQEEKAMLAFDAAVKISPTAGVWNDVAYQLALGHSHLNLARNYAESAVSTTEASLRTLTLDQITAKNVGGTSALGNSWDTLGWIAFQENDVEKAHKYVLAAWELNQNAEEADHLAQICKKTGDQEGAARYYGLAKCAKAVRRNQTQPGRTCRQREESAASD